MVDSDSKNQTMDSESSPPDAVIWVPYLSIVCLVAVLTGLIVSFYTHMIRVKKRRDNARDYVEKCIDLNRKRLYGMMRKTVDGPAKYDSLLPDSASNLDNKYTPFGASWSVYSSHSLDNVPYTGNHACQCVHNGLDPSDHSHPMGGSKPMVNGGTKEHNCEYSIPRHFHCCQMDPRMYSENVPCHCHGLVANCCCHKDSTARSKHCEAKDCNRNHRCDHWRQPGRDGTLHRDENYVVDCPNQNDNSSVLRMKPSLSHSANGGQAVPPNARSAHVNMDDERDNSFHVKSHSGIRESPRFVKDDSFVAGQRVYFQDQYRRTRSESRLPKHKDNRKEESVNNNDDDNIQNHGAIVPSPEIHKGFARRNNWLAEEDNQDTSYSDTNSLQTSIGTVPRLTPNGLSSYQTQAEINYVSEYHSNNRENKQGLKVHNNDFSNIQKKLSFSPNMKGEINPTFCHERTDPIMDSNQSLTHQPIFHTKGYDLDPHDRRQSFENKNKDGINVPKKRAKKKLNLLKLKREKTSENAFPPPIPLDVTLLAQRPLREDSNYALALSQDVLRDLPSPFGTQTNEIMLTRNEKMFDVKNEELDVVV